MSAKYDDLSRIQEIYDVARETKRLIAESKFTKDRFLNPDSPIDKLAAEGILNLVFRITEEVSHLDHDLAHTYDFERRAATGVRNRLAHAYGDVDREVIWSVVANDLDALIKSCRSYCDDQGVEPG